MASTSPGTLSPWQRLKSTTSMPWAKGAWRGCPVEYGSIHLHLCLRTSRSANVPQRGVGRKKAQRSGELDCGWGREYLGLPGACQCTIWPFNGRWEELRPTHPPPSRTPSCLPTCAPTHQRERWQAGLGRHLQRHQPCHGRRAASGDAAYPAQHAGDVKLAGLELEPRKGAGAGKLPPGEGAVLGVCFIGGCYLGVKVQVEE